MTSHQRLNDGGTMAGTVGVVGAGVMGAGLADVFASAGFEVLVHTRSEGGVAVLQATLQSWAAKRIGQGRLNEEQAHEWRSNITITRSLEDLRGCDLIIESIVENLEAKQCLFRDLDRVARPGAVLATNTSTLPVIELAMATTRPHAVCGMHFFNPASTMKLVEVVRAVTTDDATIATVVDAATACGKDVVHVADRAGFVVNALLFPYLNHAVRLWEEGVASLDDIDTAMRGGCNFPMGPFALLDLVGLDTSVAILDALHAERGDAATVAAPTLRRLVSAGHLGRKSGRGFYAYA